MGTHRNFHTCVSFQGKGQQPPACILRVQCSGIPGRNCIQGCTSDTHRVFTQPSLNSFSQTQAKAVSLLLCSSVPAHPRFNPIICLLQISRIPESSTSPALEGLLIPGSLIQRSLGCKSLPGQESPQDLPPQHVSNLLLHSARQR